MEEQVSGSVEGSGRVWRTGPFRAFFSGGSGWLAVTGTTWGTAVAGWLTTTWLDSWEFWATGFDLEQPIVPEISSNTSKAANTFVAALPLGATLIAARSIDVEIELLKFFT